MAQIKRTTKYLLEELSKSIDGAVVSEMKKMTDEELLEKLNSINGTELTMNEVFELSKPEPTSSKNDDKKTKEADVYAYCCVHGGIRFNLKSGVLHLKSANDVSVSNHYYNISLNPDKYSVTKVTQEQMTEVKKLYGNSKTLKNLFVFFAETPLLSEEKLQSVLKIRGKSPWAQMTEEDIKKTGVKKDTEE